MAAFTGAFVERGTGGFDEAAAGRVFNQRRPARSPAAVLFAADVDDVRAGVRLAQGPGLAGERALGRTQLGRLEPA